MTWMRFSAPTGSTGLLRAAWILPGGGSCALRRRVCRRVILFIVDTIFLKRPHLLFVMEVKRLTEIQV